MTDGSTTGATLPGVLGREDLLSRISGAHPLLTDWTDLDEQVQPNGIDLSLRSVSRLAGGGVLAADNAGRRLPDYEDIPFDADGFVDLAPGIYQVVYNEIVDLPNDLMALGRPRSSLCRCGATLHTAVWDAGYRGRSTSLLSVLNPVGIRLQRGARLLQLVFFGLSRPADEGYRGVYRDEHMAG